MIRRSQEGLTSPLPFENRLMRTLASNQLAFGTIVSMVRNPGIVRLIAACGFDFVLIDLQHSALTMETVGDLCEVARACNIAPIVRPYAHERNLASRLLDIGATGLMFADVTTRAQVGAILDWIHFPPRGTRGAGLPPDFRDAPRRETEEWAEQNLQLIIQVESREAVENIEMILEGGGVDIVEIGRHDLSGSFGVPGETRHPSVLNAIDTVIGACRAHGATAATGAASLEDAADMIERGITCLLYSSDRGILRSGFGQAGRALNELGNRRSD
jgi:2-keto-3-deoxy-L-rhamnonate aldolase RhmA